MSTTIEKALQSLNKADQPLTVDNVLSAYLELAGFTKSERGAVSADAILAFEHALDKHPAPPSPRRTKSGKLIIPCLDSLSSQELGGWARWSYEVAKLRDEYWKDRLANGKCRCRKCGGMLSERVEEVSVVQKKRVLNKRESHSFFDLHVVV